MASNDLIIKIKSDVSNFSLAQLKTELKSTQAELEKLRVSGSQNSQAWNDLKTKAGVLTGEIRSLNREFKGLDAQTKMNKFQLLEMGENITTVIGGFKQALSEISRFTKESVNTAAELNVLRDNFKGSTQDIEDFKKATAGTVSEGNLLKLSNQATDLGLSLSEQKLFFSLAEDAADKYGGTLEDNFQKVVYAMEGNTKGLKQLGIQKAAYEEIVKRLVKEQQGEIDVTNSANGERELTIKGLDAETQKRIRIQAFIEANGKAIDDWKNKTLDSKDKLEALNIKIEEAKTKFGGFALKAVEPLATALLGMGDSAVIATGALAKFLEVGFDLLPVLAQLKIGFPALATSIGNFASAINLGPIAIAIATIMALGDALVRLQNLMNGRGFTDDPMKEIDVKEKFKRKAEQELLDKYGVTVVTKAKLREGYTTIKVLPSYITQEDIDLLAGEMMLKEQGKWKGQQTKIDIDNKTKGGSWHKQNIEDIKEEEDATEDLLKTTEKLLNANNKEFEFLEATNKLNDDNLALLQMELIEARDKIDLEKASVKEKEAYVKLTKGINAYQDIFIKKQEEIYNKEQATKKLREESAKKNEENLKKLADLFENLKNSYNKINIDILSLSGDSFKAGVANIEDELKASLTNMSKEILQIRNTTKESVRKSLSEQGYSNDFIEKELKNFDKGVDNWIDDLNKKIKKNLKWEVDFSIKDFDIKEFYDTQTDKEVEKANLRFDKLKVDRLESQVRGILDVANQFANILGVGADTFVGKMLNGFSQAISLANSIFTLLANLGANVGSGGLFGFIGSIFGFAEGGLFTGAGTNTSDSNLIRISNGEFIVNSQATKQWLPLLQAINGNRVSSYGAYANGGLVKTNALMQPIYIYSNMDGLTFQKITQPQYQRYKNYKRL